MTNRVIRRATPEDYTTVMTVLTERITWLRDQGRDQWTTRDFHPVMTALIDQGQTWLLWEGDRPVATVTLTTIADTDFWTPAERAQPALYVSKLATSLAASGRGLGVEIMRWAYHYARSRSIPRLRWDVWRTNSALQQYYARCGFQPLRTARVAGRSSGVLYELAYTATPAPDSLRTQTSRGVIAKLASERRTPVTFGEPFGREAAPLPDHWHVLHGMRTPELSTPTATEPAPHIVPGLDTYRALLFNSGDGWRLQQTFGHPIATWTDQPHLRKGHPYLMVHDRTTTPCRVVLTGDIIDTQSSAHRVAEPAHVL